MKYQLLALDLDGTLLGSDGKIPEANLRAVERARDAGMLVVLCTGRGLVETRTVIDALSHEGPVVLAGGSLVTDPLTGHTLHRALIEPRLAMQVTEHLARLDHAVLILLDPDPSDHDYAIVNAHQLNDNTRWWFSHINASLRYMEKAREVDLHHALRVGVVASPKVMPSLQTSLLATFSERIFVQHFMAVRNPEGEEVHVLEVFAEGVNKWSGLTWLAGEHDIDLGAIAAIGDHINDVSMVEAAACGIAMGNAVHAVKHVADHITETNDEAGVANAIDRMLSGEW
ncbi:MAG: Cof-type HAD-IIB family hydrolase [Phycisphaeraceae bacterium]